MNIYPERSSGLKPPLFSHAVGEMKNMTASNFLSNGN
jgi:hypothetical protein